MKEVVLKIVKEEINDKMDEIRGLPIDNTIPNTKLHFLTAELVRCNRFYEEWRKSYDSWFYETYP